MRMRSRFAGAHMSPGAYDGPLAFHDNDRVRLCASILRESCSNVTTLTKEKKSMKSNPSSDLTVVPTAPSDETLFHAMRKIENKIAHRAYELFALSGYTDGHDLDDWLRQAGGRSGLFLIVQPDLSYCRSPGRGRCESREGDSQQRRTGDHAAEEGSR